MSYVPRVLLAAYSRSEVAFDMPHLFRKAGCSLDIYSIPNNAIKQNLYWDAWYKADESPEEYVKGLVECSKNQEYDWIVLGDDDSLRLVERYAPEEFASKVLPLSKREHRSLLSSKAGLSRLAAKFNIPTPPFAIYKEGDGVRESEQVSFPLLLKVDVSAGGRGVFFCASQEDVDSVLLRLPPHKKRALLFQKYITGKNISVEALYKNGRLLEYASSTVLKTLSGEFTVSAVRRYQVYDGLEELLTRIGRALGFDGFCSYTFMREEASGVFYLVEADLRPHAWFSFSRFAGADFSRGIRRFLEQEPLGSSAFLPPRKEGVILRYPLRDINRAFKEGDISELFAWGANSGGRWKLLPWHDSRMITFFFKRLYQELRYSFRARLSAWIRKSGSLSQYLRYYRSEKRLVFFSLFLSLLQTVSVVPVPFLARRLFDQIFPAQDIAQLIGVLALLALLFALGSGVSLFNRSVTLRATKSIVSSLRRKLIERILVFPRAFFVQEDLELVHTRVVQDTERLDRILNSLLTQALPNILVVVILSLLLLYLNALLALCMMIVVPLIYISGRFVGRMLRAQVKVFHQDFAGFSRGVSFVLRFNELVAASTAEEIERLRQIEIIERVRSSSYQMAWLSALYSTIQGNILVVGALVVLLVGGIQIGEGVTTLGTVLSFYVTLNLLLSAARSLLGIVPSFVEGAESIATLETFLSTPSLSFAESAFSGFKKEIVCKDVSFGYGKTPVLQNVSMVARKGEAVGIFGPSGSGKTTLINILLGTLLPSVGRVEIDGQSVAEINLLEYRRFVGVLHQDPLLFPGTIRDNLTYGLDGVSQERLEAAASVARIHEFITSLPEGYESVVGNRATKISGGQKQRIALARALLRSPDILILDEPDNNLDDQMVGSIISSIRRLGITVFLISHNKTLEQFVDSAVVLRDGMATQVKTVVS